MSDEIITALKARMEIEDDIKRVIRLEPVGDRFRYMIETPFKTFPKFVVGNTDDAFDEVRIEMKCGMETTAERFWNNLPDEP